MEYYKDNSKSFKKLKIKNDNIHKLKKINCIIREIREINKIIFPGVNSFKVNNELKRLVKLLDSAFYIKIVQKYKISLLDDINKNNFKRIKVIKILDEINSIMIYEKKRLSRNF